MSESACKKAKQLSDKKQYQEVSIIQIFRLRIHLFRCRNCRSYDKKNGRLTEMIEIAKIKVLGPDEKISMKRRLQKEMEKH